MTDDEFEPRSLSDWYRTKRNVVIKGTHGDKRWEMHIEPCCDAMGDAVMMNDIRESMIQIGDELFILWGDGDTIPLRYCPNCGKKIRVKK